jgi:hypothetical protein
MTLQRRPRRQKRLGSGSPRHSSTASLKKIVAGAAIARVRELVFYRADLGDAGAALLATAKLAALRAIDLYGCGVGPIGLTALIAAAPRLERIELSPLGEAQAAAILPHARIRVRCFHKPRKGEAIAALVSAGRVDVVKS